MTIQVCHRLARIVCFTESQQCPYREQWQRLTKVSCLKHLVWKELSPSRNAHVGYHGCQYQGLNLLAKENGGFVTSWK